MKKFCNLKKVILFLALNSVTFFMVMHNGINIKSEEAQGNGIAYSKEIEVIDASKVFLEVKEETDNSVKLISENNKLASNELKPFTEERNALIIGEDLNLQNAIINFNANMPFTKMTVMPTVHDYIGDNDIVRSKIEGTDKWNDLIYEVATEEGVDPVYVKCIMAQESAGQVMDSGIKNQNGTKDYGLMQVNSSWGDIYDYDRMLTDHRYAIWAGIDVLKVKSEYAQKFDKEPTIFNVSWFYNGYSKDGKEYAEEISSIYEDLTGNNAETTEFRKN